MQVFQHVLQIVQIYHAEDDELQEGEVENVLVLQGAPEADSDSDRSEEIENSDSDSAADSSIDQ